MISNYCSVRKLLHVACFTVVLETCGEQSKQEWRQDCPLWCLSITNHHTSCANWSHSDRPVEVVTPILSSFSLRSGWMVLKMWREKNKSPKPHNSLIMPIVPSILSRWERHAAACRYPPSTETGLKGWRACVTCKQSRQEPVSPAPSWHLTSRALVWSHLTIKQINLI